MKLSFATKFAIGTALLIGVGYLLYTLAFITLTVAAGFTLFLIIDQMLDWLRRQGLSQKQAQVVLGLGGTAVFVAFFLYVSLPLLEQIQGFGQQFPQFLEGVRERVALFEEANPFIKGLGERSRAEMTAIVQSILALSGSILTALITIPIITVTLLATRKELSLLFSQAIPNNQFEVTTTVVHQIVDHIKTYVSAKSLETLIMIVIQAAGFWLIGLPQGLFLGVLAGTLNIIPYIGPLLSIVPVALIAISFGSGKLLGLSLLVIFIAQLIDNALLQTWLVSKYVNVHPLIAVIVTLIGGEVLGPLGLILAIPLYVISRIIFTGLYDYLRALQRHEFLLEQEESAKQHAAH